jgi:hypothetical protein
MVRSKSQMMRTRMKTRMKRVAARIVVKKTKIARVLPRTPVTGTKTRRMKVTKNLQRTAKLPMTRRTTKIVWWT